MNNDKIIEFLERVSKVESACLTCTAIADDAKGLLNEIFIEQVRDLFEYELVSGWRVKENRKKYHNISKVDLATEVRFSDSKKEFIEKHWNELDRVIKILNEYIDELELKSEELKETEE